MHERWRRLAASHWASTFSAEFDLNKPINFKGVHGSGI
jgi:hypothetical protein